MKLELHVKEGQHSEAATGVGWSSAEELITCGEDHKIKKSGQSLDEMAEIVDLGNAFTPTKFSWLTSASTGSKKTGKDLFAVGSAEGHFKLISKSGRIETSVNDAHKGAITDLRWSPDGSSIVTAGEDGCVKIWAKGGVLRSTLVQSNIPVYAAAWSPNSDSVTYTSGKLVVVKPLQPAAKTEQWKAHDGVVLALDRNNAHNCIVTGGEDRKYKVWDAFGSLLYASALHDHPISAVAWAPDGSLFAVGSYNTLRVCDRIGWSRCMEKPASGSIYSLAWTDDGTQLAAACATGAVLHTYILQRRVVWGAYECTLVAPNTLDVRNCVTSGRETLDFRDHVVQMNLSHGHLVVATMTQCFIYAVENWRTPVVFDLPRDGTITLICQSAKRVLLVDSQEGLQVYDSVDGKLLCSPKIPNMRVEMLHENTVSLSDDIIAIRDARDEKVVHIIDVISGKAPNKPVSHSSEIQRVALNQSGSSSDRQLAILDKNSNLYLTSALASVHRFEKLATMVLSVAWQERTSMLAALANSKLTVWYAPGSILADKTMFTKARFEKDASEYGKSPTIVSFQSNFITVRRADGVLLTAGVAPHPALMLQLVSERKWKEATRLCRFMKDASLWAGLAVLASMAKEIGTAETAYAAIEEVDRVFYLQQVKSIPSPEGRNAAMAVFCHQVEEAENILISSGLIYRAILTNIQLFRWERALELAVKHKTHVDTVLAHRQRYLAQSRRPETDTNFMTFAQSVEVDWPTVQEKMSAEIEAERTRPGAKPYA